ncbi:MAG: class B sortase [Aristaeellaceae bacterium]
MKHKHTGARRALLVLILLASLGGAGLLGYLGATELLESKAGSDFYAALASAAKVTVTPAPTPSMTDAATPAPAEAIDPDAPEELPPEDGELTPLLPTPEPTATPRQSVMDFAALQETCPDLVGWIRLEDSIIDYPVAQGEDNEYYLYHLADGTENKSGTIMMDVANAPDFTDAVTILHGHHMRGGAMFGQLSYYKKESYYQTHSVIQLFTPEGDYDVAVFAACTVNGYTFGYPVSFADETEFDAFVRKAVSSTPYETGVTVSYGDRLLVLSTCAYTFEGARYVVMGKILEPEVVP